jgi:hypothetical protein
MKCPVCNSSSAVDYIGNVINNGTHTTYFGGSTLTFSAEGNQYSVTDLSSTNMSAPARSLLAPERPGLPVGIASLYFTLSVIICGIWMVNTAFKGDPFGYFILLPIYVGLGSLFSLIPMFVHWLIALMIRPRYYARGTRLVQSFYCYDDDIAFNEAFAAKPRAFVQYIFRH